MANLAVQAGSQHRYYAYFLLAKGMAEYRIGGSHMAHGNADEAKTRYEAAVRLLKQSRNGMGNPRSGWSIYCRVTADLFLAMSHHQLGNQELARETLQRAQDDMRAFPQESDAPGGAWNDLFVCRIAHREAVREILGPVD